jgi:hypothetical protein
MRTEGILHVKFYKYPTGNRNWNLPFCGGLPQPSAVQFLPSGGNGIGGWAILRAVLKVANYVFFLTFDKKPPYDVAN